MNPRLSEDMKDVQSRLNDSTVVGDFMRSLKIKSLHDSISIDKLDESTKKLLRSGVTGSEIYNSLLSTVGLERLIKSATVGGEENFSRCYRKITGVISCREQQRHVFRDKGSKKKKYFGW